MIFLVSSVELLVTSEGKEVGQDHHNIWAEGTVIFRGSQLGNETKESKLLEVVKPLFNISFDKHDSSP